MVPRRAGRGPFSAAYNISPAKPASTGLTLHTPWTLHMIHTHGANGLHAARMHARTQHAARAPCRPPSAPSSLARGLRQDDDFEGLFDVEEDDSPLSSSAAAAAAAGTGEEAARAASLKTPSPARRAIATGWKAPSGTGTIASLRARRPRSLVSTRTFFRLAQQSSAAARPVAATTSTRCSRTLAGAPSATCSAS